MDFTSTSSGELYGTASVLEAILYELTSLDEKENVYFRLEKMIFWIHRDMSRIQVLYLLFFDHYTIVFAI